MDIRRGQDEWEAIADSPVNDPGRALAYAQGEEMLYAAGAATEQASANAEADTTTMHWLEASVGFLLGLSTLLIWILELGWGRTSTPGSWISRETIQLLTLVMGKL